MGCVVYGVTKSRTRLSDSRFHANTNTVCLFLLHSSKEDLILFNRGKHLQKGFHGEQDGKKIFCLFPCGCFCFYLKGLASLPVHSGERATDKHLMGACERMDELSMSEWKEKGGERRRG